MFRLPAEDNIRSVDLDELLRLWSMTEVRMLCRGQAELVEQAVPVLHRLRGAMGRYLAVGASDAALAGKPCDFAPPCAYAAFHNDLPGPFRDGRLPKPFVPMLDRVGNDLLITFRLFGRAAVWAGEFRSAMVAGVRMGLDQARAAPLVLSVEGSAS